MIYSGFSDRGCVHFSKLIQGSTGERGTEIKSLLGVSKGSGGVDALDSDAVTEQKVEEAGAVQKNVLEDVRSCAETLAERSRSELVTVIGRKFSLYKPFKDKPVIVLPKKKGSADVTE